MNGKSSKFLVTFSGLLLIMLIPVKAQVDSIIFNNGNYVVGEIKSMNRNVLEIETDYSDDDFTIEWDGIKEIYTTTNFLITLTSGNRYNGTIQSDGTSGINIQTEGGETINVQPDEIVVLDDVDFGFWSQLYASIDIGYDLTRSKNLRSFSMNSNVGYIARRWQLDATFNRFTSRQDDVEDIQRSDGGLTFKYFLPRDWYPTASTNWLSNTEQQLRLRTTAKLGFGKYVVHTNQLYWGFSVGANYNQEDYSPPELDDRTSWEGYAGTELNLFNVGDLNLQTSLLAYPSFTESGRIRSDFNFNVSYDLPLDFYVKAGFTLNYDNQPAEGSPKADYVLKTGFGWSW
jgi:hypothetical protein